MVPIGKRAFMKGKLIHTNEILACLGDNYFAKYSAAQAIALCNRRIECMDTHYTEYFICNIYNSLILFQLPMRY